MNKKIAVDSGCDMPDAMRNKLASRIRIRARFRTQIANMS